MSLFVSICISFVALSTNLQFKWKSSGLLGDRQFFFRFWKFPVVKAGDGGGEASVLGRRKLICSPRDLRRRGDWRDGGGDAVGEVLASLIFFPGIIKVKRR